MKLKPEEVSWPNLYKAEEKKTIYFRPSVSYDITLSQVFVSPLFLHSLNILFSLLLKTSVLFSFVVPRSNLLQEFYCCLIFFPDPIRFIDFRGFPSLMELLFSCSLGSGRSVLLFADTFVRYTHTNPFCFSLCGCARFRNFYVYLVCVERNMGLLIFFKSQCIP